MSSMMSTHGLFRVPLREKKAIFVDRAAYHNAEKEKEQNYIKIPSEKKTQ